MKRPRKELPATIEPAAMVGVNEVPYDASVRTPEDPAGRDQCTIAAEIDQGEREVLPRRRPCFAIHLDEAADVVPFRVGVQERVQGAVLVDEAGQMVAVDDPVKVLVVPGFAVPVHVGAKNSLPGRLLLSIHLHLTGRCGEGSTT